MSAAPRSPRGFVADFVPWPTFDRLLRRQRVPIHRHAPRKATQRGWRIVVIEDARAAVDRDCAQETITAAATRLRMSRSTLAKAVLAELRRKGAGTERRRKTLRRPAAFYDRVARSIGRAA